MPEYESCSFEQATHVANADRSIVHKITDTDTGTETLSVQLEDHDWIDEAGCKFYGFTPVKEKKVGWQVMEAGPDDNRELQLAEDTHTVYCFNNRSKPLAEKICRLLNEEEK